MCSISALLVIEPQHFSRFRERDISHKILRLLLLLMCDDGSTCDRGNSCQMTESPLKQTYQIFIKRKSAQENIVSWATTARVHKNTFRRRNGLENVCTYPVGARYFQQIECLFNFRNETYETTFVIIYPHPVYACFMLAVCVRAIFRCPERVDERPSRFVPCRLLFCVKRKIVLTNSLVLLRKMTRREWKRTRTRLSCISSTDAIRACICVHLI